MVTAPPSFDIRGRPAGAIIRIIPIDPIDEIDATFPPVNARRGWQQQEQPKRGATGPAGYAATDSAAGRLAGAYVVRVATGAAGCGLRGWRVLGCARSRERLWR